MLVSLNDIQDNIDSKYYQRGIQYYSQNTIKFYKSNIHTDTNGEDTLTIISKVKGSSLYSQNIDITYISTSDVLIEGSCSCPVGYNCKHIAAVCIKYTTDYMAKQISEVGVQSYFSNDNISLVDKWLSNLEDTISSKSKQKVLETDYFLTYRLGGKKFKEKGKLSFCKSKYLKNGSLSKGTFLDAYKLQHSYSYSELKSEADKEIIKLSSALFDHNYYSPSMDALTGELGYMIASKALATTRAFYDTAQTPLRLIQEPLHVTYEFKLYKGEYTLKSNILSKEHELLETTPPLLINKVTNEVRELDIDIEFYKQLLNAPKIPKEEIAKVYTQVARKLPTVDIITPKAIDIKKIDASPTPSLHLKFTQEAHEKSFNSFTVDFLYDKYSVKYLPREEKISFYENEQKIEILRDLKFEESVKAKIESYGFSTELVDDNISVTLETSNRQTQLKIWRDFLQNHLETLKREGWQVEIDEEFNMKFEPSCEIVAESEEKNDWFSLSFNLEFNGISQAIAPLVTSIIQEFDNFENIPELINIEVSENHFVEIQTKQIKPIINTIIELLDKKEKDNTLKISPFDAHLLDFMDDNIIWRGNKDIIDLSNRLKDFKGIQKVPVPKALNAELRAYQQEGLNWLDFLYEYKFGGVLADDMGLGKTIQTLANLSRLKEAGKLITPSLIVMPTSLIANWKQEAAKFTPNLRVLSLHGSDRAGQFDLIREYDVLLTTYPLIVRDQEKFLKHKFFYIILDEAQKIKNHKTKMAVALKTLRSEHRLALSGTPIENHLGELWSIFSFLMPGFLDTMRFFKNYYQTPIEKEHNFERQNLLNKRIKPFMLRRTKEVVATELPPKSEIIKYTQFEGPQSKLYESIRVTMEKRVQEAVSAKGIGSSHITILDALLKLRQVCCDPSLLKIEEAQKVHHSAKLELFIDLVDELLAEGRKILVFSQFTSMLSILEQKIKQKQISYTKLTGSTRKREEAIAKFTDGNADIFLISLKAGGVGLNLTQADTVIHYDPWWNPAVENQATDRAYRIGQDKAVFVYKLIIENTIEQKILEMQKKKQSLQDGIYDSNKQQDDMNFGSEELLSLLG
ncbi:DEAD/DEAH box helicase [Sulfurimonas sp. SAG-AH-194-C20]|nr:DEAD/DEAH box helicase [Sulfurimonas sp. SAG-AH-194-C20]MDF1878391.1 DEAD/DEAH box helicase [Sulfurimonas sp. SAG-AH-194-C20]